MQEQHAAATHLRSVALYTARRTRDDVILGAMRTSDGASVVHRRVTYPGGGAQGACLRGREVQYRLYCTIPGLYRPWRPGVQ